MQSFIDNIKIEEYVPTLIEGATNVLIAAVILIVGLFIAGKVNRVICKMGESQEK